MTFKFTSHVDTSTNQTSSLLGILRFTTKILLSKYPHYVFPILCTFYFAKQMRLKRKITLELLFVSEDAFASVLPRNGKHPGLENIDSCILVSFNTLKTLGVSSYSWVKLEKRLVQITAIPNLKGSLAVVTNVLAHNLSKSSLHVNNKTTVTINKTEVLETFTPHVATLVKVSFIQTCEIDSVLLGTILTNYFECPRYLQIDDVFGIDVLKYAPAIHYQNNKVKTLCFKVVDIHGPCYEDSFDKNTHPGYYVLKELSTLVQLEHHKGYIPRSDVLVLNKKTDLQDDNLKLRLKSGIPSGLEVYRDELLTCIQPFLSTTDSSHIKPLFLLCGPSGGGKEEIVKNVSEMLGMNEWTFDSVDLQGSSSNHAEIKLKYIFTKVHQLSPCIFILKNAELLCKDKNGNEDSRAATAFIEEVQNFFQQRGDFPVVIIAVCNSKDANTTVIPTLARLFLQVIRVQSPDDAQRVAMINWLLDKEDVITDVDLYHIASQTTGYLYADIVALVSLALRNLYKRLKSCDCQHECSVILTKQDFEEALDKMQSAYSDAIDAPKIPKVSWDDVGGLVELKEEIIRTIMLPLQHPELLTAGLRRSGILLYGPPGTGKTLLAKAISTECNLNFLSVKGPELLNMYVGQSEENVREVFDRARAASPCIIFFDELDSLAPNRGRSGDSGGVMDRVVSQLLAEMDGLQKSAQLFVIGATNRPDLIDPALLRPGRFDKLLYVGVCEDKKAQVSVMEALTRRFHLKTDVILEDVVALLPQKLTGADLYSICSRAWLNAVKSYITSLLPSERCLSSFVEVGLEDFKEAINGFVPSISQEDLAYYEKIKDKL